jgi:hypothetical protein
MTWEGPAKYPKEEPFTLDRDSRVEDICGFIMEYIVSDVLVRGLLKYISFVLMSESGFTFR